MRHETTVFIWDLDKTYLVSHFESLRQLLRVPFEKAQDKVAVPGAVPLIRALRRSLRRRGWPVRVYFVSASPPQIAGAIREKLALDGIDYDGIAFKDQMRHLMSARFSAVREHVGYKLEQLLRDARELEPESRLVLFGDDWESDPLVYSLFADIIEGHLERERVLPLLETADVDEHYLSRIEQLLSGDLPRLEVRRIFILRQRPVAGAEFDVFGARLTWVDDYFEAALKLFSMGCLDVAGVLDVAFDLRRSPAHLAEALDEFDRRGGVDRAALGPALRALERSGLLPAVAVGPPWRRLPAAVRRRFGGANKRRRPTVAADYQELIERWSYRGRKEAGQASERSDSGDRSADNRG